jgi:hypothetical protein
MSNHSKKYETYEALMKAVKALIKFQRIHKDIRDDYLELLQITENHKSIEKTFDALYRASLKSLFSLIEADIYGLNTLDPYEGYKDRHTFIFKFKETFKQIASTWNKQDIQVNYFESKLKGLIELKEMRDELIHPKDIGHIHKASEISFKRLKTVFNEYDSFINDLMNDFFLGVMIPFPM